MLSELFTRFDKICITHHVYKVHTIGDCYVVMGYTGNEHRDPGNECMNMVRMSKDMIAIIDEINDENGSELKMRIGMHTGEIIAGVVGTTIVRYDIYGTDVFVANKMESSGAPGRINISDVTKDVLEDYYPGCFRFEYNKEISVKAMDRTHSSFFIQD